MKRRSSERILGKLLFGAFLMFAAKLLEPLPVLRMVLNIAALAA